MSNNLARHSLGPTAGEVFRTVSGVSNQNKIPPTIKAVVYDLDGTMMASYKTLEAIAHAKSSLVTECGMNIQTADRFITGLIQEYTFQKLLHRPEKTVDFLRRYTKDNNVTLPDGVFREIVALHRQAFTAYDRLKEVLLIAKEAGVPNFIYTNSPDYFAVKRLASAGIDPVEHGVIALWSKIENAHEPLSWLNPQSCDTERRWAESTIPYSFKKPSDLPLQQIMHLADVNSENILFVGEGTKDLGSAYPKGPHQRSAIFCFQEKGARDICPIQRKTNEVMRPGAEPLGLEAFETYIREHRINPDEIIRLRQGFPDLEQMFRSNEISLVAPPQIPHVVNRTLVVDKPHLASNVVPGYVGIPHPQPRPGEAS